MNNGKYYFGAVPGIFFGFAGLVLGLWCSWKGFSSQPFTGEELGIYCGTLGAILGVSSGAFGLGWRIYRKSLNGR